MPHDLLDALRLGLDDQPIRPKPMNPHVAHDEAVAEKVLRVAGVVGPVKPPFPFMHSFEGEKRMETAALMTPVKCYSRWGGDKEVG